MSIQSNRQRGITLIELMIVLAVLSITAAIAIPAYTGYVAEGRISECRNEVAAIRLAEEEFFLTNNIYIAGTLDGTAGPDLTLANNLGNAFYTPSAIATGPNTACTYAVVLGAAGPPSYTITATGVGVLAVRDVVVNVVGP